MRPVQLILDGFGTFRSRAVIDFADADYFALIGATGAGKSTVLDGITFALYGNVPRWNHIGMIAPALAPTATRAVVRLVFDADGTRYVAAREARRSGGRNPTVSMHASRLERLHDRDDFDGETDVLAADTEVTPAVAKLLGLSYQHFTTCVALPQGRFAEFLHAKASDRQEILSGLLGYEFYDELHKRANRTSRDHEHEAAAHKTTLDGYTDATAAHVADRESVATQLAELRTALSDVTLPALDEAANAVTEAETVSRDLRKQHEALSSVHLPADVTELDAGHAAALSAHADARAAASDAEQADASAAAAVAAFETRFELQTTAQRWADLAEARTSLPEREQAASAASAALGTAKAATDAVEETAESSRRAAELARNAALDADAARELCAGQVETLNAVAAPDGIGELAATLTDLTERRTANGKDTELAEQSCETTRAALNKAAAPGTVADGLRASDNLTSALRQDLDAAADRTAAAAAAAQLDSEAAAARNAADVAAAMLEQARLDDVAGTLRAHLQAGEICPVCEQSVSHVPSGVADGDIAALTAAHVAAQQRAAAAELAKSGGDRAADQAAATREAQLGHAQTARDQLNEVRDTLKYAAGGKAPFASVDTPITAATPDAELSAAAQAAAHAHAALTVVADERQELQDAYEAADDLRRSAVAARRALDSDTREVEDRRRAAATALTDARNTVHSMGVPQLDSADLGRAWATLTRWAEQEHATQTAQLATLTDTQSAAEKAAARAHDLHVAAATTLTEQRALESSAEQAAARAAGALEDTTALIVRLEAALDGGPDAGIVAAKLSELDTLESAAATSRSERDTARQQEKTAAAALKDVAAGVLRSRGELTAVRDPLTRYGAPPISDSGLAAQWAALAQWAADRTAALALDITAARKTEMAAASGYTAAVSTISDAFAAHNLPAPPADATAAALRSAAVATVASAAATAQSEAVQAAKRLKDRKDLEARQTAAAAQSQVARTLAQLLRSDGFRAWLFESALSSLVHDASAILFEMSSGQFELRSGGRDIEVIDHNDADTFRPVRTLSGGETFQASLALALALSRQVATLAASGAAKLESIFLDEGFGTLDEASLDVVAGTLETLSSSGERMVGIVTHVAALADQVPVRFEVARIGPSSTITRVNA